MLRHDGVLLLGAFTLAFGLFNVHSQSQITEGGVRVNPLNYLTGYVAAW